MGEMGEFPVEAVLDAEVRGNGKVFFLIKWEGYSDDDNTWEPQDHIPPPILQDFWEDHPTLHALVQDQLHHRKPPKAKPEKTARAKSLPPKRKYPTPSRNHSCSSAFERKQPYTPVSDEDVNMFIKAKLEMKFSQPSVSGRDQARVKSTTVEAQSNTLGMPSKKRKVESVKNPPKSFRTQQRQFLQQLQGNETKNIHELFTSEEVDVLVKQSEKRSERSEKDVLSEERISSTNFWKDQQSHLNRIRGEKNKDMSLNASEKVNSIEDSERAIRTFNIEKDELAESTKREKSREDHLLLVQNFIENLERDNHKLDSTVWEPVDLEAVVVSRPAKSKDPPRIDCNFGDLIATLELNQMSCRDPRLKSKILSLQQSRFTPIKHSLVKELIHLADHQQFFCSILSSSPFESSFVGYEACCEDLTLQIFPFFDSASNCDGSFKTNCDAFLTSTKFLPSLLKSSQLKQKPYLFLDLECLLDQNLPNINFQSVSAESLNEETCPLRNDCGDFLCDLCDHFELFLLTRLEKQYSVRIVKMGNQFKWESSNGPFVPISRLFQINQEFRILELLPSELHELLKNRCIVLLSGHSKLNEVEDELFVVHSQTLRLSKTLLLRSLSNFLKNPSISLRGHYQRLSDLITESSIIN